MYIFELMYNLVHKFLNRKKKLPQNNPIDYGDYCEHVFLPVDSTKQILACSKCGLLVKAKDLKVKKDNDAQKKTL